MREYEKICNDIFGNAFVFLQNYEGAFSVSAGRISGRRD